MSPAEVARYLGCHVQTVYSAINDGSLPAVTLGRFKKICWPDLRNFIGERRAA